MANMARYLKCLTDGVPANTGVPDGNAKPSITWNRRFLNVLKPDANGDLKFTVYVSATGVITQCVGANYSGERFPLDSSAPSGVAASTYVVSSYNRIKDEVCQFHSQPSVVSTASDSAYRVVNAVHQLRFTGSALANGGTVTVTAINNEPEDDVIGATVGGVSISRPVDRDNAYIRPVLNSTSMVGSAREPITLIHLPRDTSYYSTSRNGANLEYSNQGYEIANQCAAHMHHPSTRVYVIEYSGLDKSASITVDSRVCVQETVPGGDSLQSLARPSEMTDTNMLNNFLGSVANSPLASWGVDQAKRMVTAYVRSRYPALSNMITN